MALSESTIRSAKPKDKPYKLSDSGGLYLQIAKSGGKLWRLKYRFSGAEKLLAIGAYPDISLKQARDKRDEAKKLLLQGIDPSANKRRKAVAAKISSVNTFNALAVEYIEKMERDSKSPATMIKLKWFANLLNEGLGKLPISNIEPFEILTVLKEIEKRGNYETCKRVRAFAARVFRYAIITGRAKANPAADLGEALTSAKVRHHAAIVKPNEVGELLRTIDSYDGNILTVISLKLIANVFVRPGELRHAEWSEIDFDNQVWRIPATKMKMREDHAVPLSRQSLELLSEAKYIGFGSKYIFPSFISKLKPMSENTLNTALRRMGYSNEEMTAHGFRSTACSLLNESGLWSSDAIERALAHKDRDAIRGIYHRGKHWEERVKMAQWWSDYLDILRTGGEVVPFTRLIS